jgi:hypothetical protein
MAMEAKFAVYGALPGGDGTNAQAIDVTRKLQNLINNNGGIVACNDSSLGDPSPGNLKHFGALVQRSDGLRFFACDENQTIDFNREENTFGGRPHVDPKGRLAVKFAVWGALDGGDRAKSSCADVSQILQAAINSNAMVVLNNDTFHVDPAPGNLKHFAAVVNREGRDFAFACAEGQTINFDVGGS